MREIKFRQFIGGRFEYWGIGVGGFTFVSASSGGADNATNTPSDQYTGLKDRNGVEIYEGDIVTWGDVDGYIEMSGTRVAVVDMSAPEDGLTFDAFKPIKSRFKIGNFMYRRSIHKCMTVIGNVHENHDLLES